MFIWHWMKAFGVQVQNAWSCVNPFLLLTKAGRQQLIDTWLDSKMIVCWNISSWATMAWLAPSQLLAMFKGFYHHVDSTYLFLKPWCLWAGEQAVILYHAVARALSHMLSTS